MTKLAPDLKLHLEPFHVGRLIAAASNPRDKAFVSLLARTGIRISEAIGLKVIDIDFQRGTLTIVHLKEKSKLKCPHCGESLGKRHLFCPACGNKVGQALREKVEQRRQRTIPVDRYQKCLVAQRLDVFPIMPCYVNGNSLHPLFVLEHIPQIDRLF